MLLLLAYVYGSYKTAFCARTPTASWLMSQTAIKLVSELLPYVSSVSQGRELLDVRPVWRVVGAPGVAGQRDKAVSWRHFQAS